MASKDSTLTQKRLKQVVHYNSETGAFTTIIFRNGSSKKIGEQLGSATINKGKTYKNMRIDTVIYPLHRLAWLYVHGEFPPNEIDHIDGNGTNNRINNLRAVTHRENGRNMRKTKANTSGITGIRWRESHKKWVARIRANDRDNHLGIFIEKWDAICARKSAESKYGFHPNHGSTRPL